MACSVIADISYPLHFPQPSMCLPLDERSDRKSGGWVPACLTGPALPVLVLAFLTVFLAAELGQGQRAQVPIFLKERHLFQQRQRPSLLSCRQEFAAVSCSIWGQNVNLGDAPSRAGWVDLLGQ